MSHYRHLTIYEREEIHVLIEQNLSIRKIAEILKRHPSTISREIKKNQMGHSYSPSRAQRNYERNQKKSGRKRLLENSKLKALMYNLFLERQWSPEGISARLKHEKYPIQISFSTIYRAIYRGVFDPLDIKRGNRGAKRKLRHKGKTRRTTNHKETRGKIKISHSIHERPLEANRRLEVGHWEADTVVGKIGKACLITLTDRKSRFLLMKKIDKKRAASVKMGVLSMLKELPCHKRKTVTPDRGKEFAHHQEIADSLGSITFYFADPNSPWQRGTNENTNGLLREYLPKKIDITPYTETDIAILASKLNHRPKKCLNWKTPYEVFFDEVLHLI